MALDKEVRIEELNNSGSKAIKSIDPYGRHNYFAEQMKDVNGSMDGEISGKLRRPKYDEEQLLLAIDTEIDELIPDKPKDLPDVVLRSDYDALQAQLDACLAREAELRRQLADAQAKISELESEIAGLKAELDASKLRIAVAENSAEAAADKFAQTSIDLQQAIQKSVAEAIERVSLEAQVEGLVAQKEALIQQVDSLENQVAGQAAALASGGEQAGGTFITNVTPVSEQGEPTLKYYSSKKGSKGTGWKNGPNIEVLNLKEEPITISFSKAGDVGWLQLPAGGTVPAKDRKTFVCGPSGNNIKSGGTGTKTGTLTVTASDGVTQDLPVKRVHHKNSNKIICEELYQQGYISFEIYRADEEWGDMMFKKDPRLIVGYLMWAKHVVNWMKKYPVLTGIFYYTVSKYWCAWMADQMGVKVNQKHIWIGELLHKTLGTGLSYWVFDNFDGARRLRIMNYLEAKDGN